MKKMVLLAALAALTVTASRAQMVTLDQKPYIEVNARAYEEVVPDEIFVRVTLDENDQKGKVPLPKMEKNFFTAVKKAGLDPDKDVSVADLSSDIRNYLLKRSDGRTSKEYLVKVDSKTLVSLFRELDANAIYTAEIQSARYSKIEELQDKLRTQAVQTARKRADMMSEAIGQKAGKALFIQSYDNNVGYDAIPVLYSRAMAKSSNVVAEATPEVDFKKIRVEVSVTCRFEL